MTTTPILTGRDIGAAERATRALLDRLLDAAEVPFPEWTVLFTLSGSGPLPASALIERQVDGLKVTTDVAQATIDALLARGLIAPSVGTPAATVDDPVLAFTRAGEAVYLPIRRAVDQIAADLYGDIPTPDLEATHRTLAEVTRRANARLGATA
jgi:DNA-binding MarR family transcriptional regulator